MVCLPTDCCSFISRRLGSIVRLETFESSENAPSFFIGVAEDAEPVELRLANELLQNFKSEEDSPGKPTMNEVRNAMPEQRHVP